MFVEEQGVEPRAGNADRELPLFVHLKDHGVGQNMTDFARIDLLAIRRSRAPRNMFQ